MQGRQELRPPGGAGVPGRGVVPLVSGALVAAVLTAALHLLGYGPDAGGRDCLRLTLVSSSNKARLVSALADGYHDTDPVVGSACVRVHVVSQASGVTADALVGGWDPVSDGPPPVVWSPASSAWIHIVRHRQASRGAPVTVSAPAGLLAQSPQVIAMPRPMARQLGWPDRAIGWRDVFDLVVDPAGWGRHGRPEWGRFRLGKTSIRHSTSALNATVVSYLAATGTSGELTAEQLADPAVQSFVRSIESSVEHYGDTSLAFLENLRRADDRGDTLRYLSGVILEEKSVWDYNRGNPSGDPQTLGRRPPPGVPLAAVYPEEGTLMADHPYAVVDVPSTSAADRTAAADFLRFLQEPAQQREFQRAGFRDHRGRPGPEISPANGLLPDGVVERPLPEPSILDALQRSWRGLRKRARVLLVVDVSGSMSTPVPGTGTTKLGLVKRAAAASLPQFENEDDVGLWLFSPASAGEKPFQEVVPLAPYGARGAELREKLDGLAPGPGPSRLYATLEAAVARLQDGVGPDRITGVVLVSDGPNDDRVVTDVSRLTKRLEAAARDGIQVYPVAYGAGADRATLRRIAEASRTTMYDASDPADIETVLPAAVSNFGSPGF